MRNLKPTISVHFKKHLGVTAFVFFVYSMFFNFINHGKQISTGKSYTFGCLVSPKPPQTWLRKMVSGSAEKSEAGLSAPLASSAKIASDCL